MTAPGICADERLAIQSAPRSGCSDKVRKAFLPGNLIVDGDQWLGREGMGQFLQRGESGRL